MTRLIPVLDAMNGRVVRALGGRRDLYEPIRSQLTQSIEPQPVAEALLAASGANELYVADLDAIQGHRPQLKWLRPFVDRGVKVMVDAGVRLAADGIAVASAGAAIVAGTETLQSFDELAKMIRAWDASRVLLSIDLRNGAALGSERDPLVAVERGIEVGVTRVLLLELARVGTGLGPGTEELCKSIRDRYPAIELIAGGGVRNRKDVDSLLAAGANAVLVASALHDRTL